MHVLVLGQSNVANHGETQFHSDFGKALFDGALVPLSDPVPGGSGPKGSIWPLIADHVQAAGRDDRFIVSLCAKGGTSVAEWSTGGPCYQTFVEDRLPSILNSPDPVTHIVYHQGEKDTLLETSAQNYVDSFDALHNVLIEYFPGVPIVVCTVSHRMGIRSEDVRGGQMMIQTSRQNCHAGPDTDLLGPDYRYDNTHFNEAGQRRFASEMSATLLAMS